MFVKHGLNFWLATLMLFIVAPLPVKALEIAITDNGGGSTSEVVVEQTNNTTVEQTNQTSVNNDVQVEAQTGANTASGNTGETTVETGDINTQVDISNTVNDSVVDTPCCSTQGNNTQVLITGNGGDSTNIAAVTTTNATIVTINQQAEIKNFISGSAVTGRNTVSDNQGNVLINTGTVHASVNLINKANNGNITVAQNQAGDTLLKIAGNGEGSNNTIAYSTNNSANVYIDELSDIVNRIGFELITGENKADDNNGDVTIKTGDVYLTVNVENETNKDIVVVDCCDKDGDTKPPEPPIKPPEPPIKPPEPPQPPVSSGGGGGGSGSNNGSNSAGVGGAVLGASDEMLPATGTFDSLLMTIASVFFLLLGGYLRLRSGRSPS